jgi:hypothetical protein
VHARQLVSLHPADTQLRALLLELEKTRLIEATAFGTDRAGVRANKSADGHNPAALATGQSVRLLGAADI